MSDDWDKPLPAGAPTAADPPDEASHEMSGQRAGSFGTPATTRSALAVRRKCAEVPAQRRAAHLANSTTCGGGPTLDTRFTASRSTPAGRDGSTSVTQPRIDLPPKGTLTTVPTVTGMRPSASLCGRRYVNSRSMAGSSTSTCTACSIAAVCPASCELRAPILRCRCCRQNRPMRRRRQSRPAAYRPSTDFNSSTRSRRSHGNVAPLDSRPKWPYAAVVW